MKENNIANSLTLWVDDEIKVCYFYGEARDLHIRSKGFENYDKRYFAVRILNNKITETISMGSRSGDAEAVFYTDLPETFRTQLLLLGIDYEIN